MFIYLILFAVLLAAGLKIAPKGQFHEDFLSLKVSKGIQGFCAIAIICHHFSQYLIYNYDGAGSLNIFENIGVWFVGIFFFCSGYGIIKSYRTKENYLHGFLKKRLPVILVPFYVITIIFTIISISSGKNFYNMDNVLTLGIISPLTVILSLIGIMLVNSHAWYIVAITVFYLAFYFCFKKSKNDKNALIHMGIFSVIYILVCIVLGHGFLWFQGEWWYNSSFLFFIGMLVAYNEEKITAYAKEKYKILLPISLIGTVITILLDIFILHAVSYYSSIVGCFVCLAFQLPSIIFFVMFVLLVSMKIKFNNPALDFLGKIALEVYLIHNLFLAGFRSNCIFIENDILYLAAIYASTILAACILHVIDQKLIKSIKHVPSANQQK